MSKLWVYIWRFQPFHNGHASVVEQMIQDNKKNILIIGTLETDEKNNPYSADWREEVIKQIFWENIIIHLVADDPDNLKWSQSIRDLLAQYSWDEYVFYGGDINNDYAIKVIWENTDVFAWKKIHFKEISRNIIPLRATQVREKIKKWESGWVKQSTPKEVYRKIKNTIK